MQNLPSYQSTLYFKRVLIKVQENISIFYKHRIATRDGTEAHTGTQGIVIHSH